MNINKLFDEMMLDIETTIKLSPWHDKNFYANWLSQSYYFVRHSTRLLSVASAQTNFQQNGYHNRLGDHFAEEKSHEVLASGDLKKLGFKLDDFEELEITKIFYRNQYFGCERMSPYYLMGYILFLEGLAIIHGPHIYKIIEKNFGARTCNFMRVHVEEDDDHLRKAFKELEGLSESDLNHVEESMKISCSLYGQLLKELSADKIKGFELDPVIHADAV